MFGFRKISSPLLSVLTLRRHARNALLVTSVVALATCFSSLPIAQSQQTQTQTPQQRLRRVTPAEDVRQDESDEVLRVDTDLVLVDVTVTNAAGRPVRNLTAGDFKLYDEGVERPIAFFNVERRRRSGESRPVAVVFAVDVSGSMSPNEMERLAVAMRAIWEGGAVARQVTRRARQRAAGPRRAWADVARETRAVYAAALLG